MASQREIRQIYIRNVMQVQDQMHLEQNGYNHDQNLEANFTQNNNFVQSFQNQEDQFTLPCQNNTRNSQMICQNEIDIKNGQEKVRGSNEKIDSIPKEIYDFFKNMYNLKKQSSKSTLKKWYDICKEERENKRCAISQYNKKVQVEKRSLKLSIIQEKFYKSNKIKFQPSEQDLAFFISCLNCYEPNKSQLRLIFDEGIHEQGSQNEIQQSFKPEELLFITLNNSIFQELQELSIKVVSEQLYNPLFFKTCISILHFHNLSYFELSFINSNTEQKLNITGQQLIELSNDLRKKSPRLNYLVLDLKEIELGEQDFQLFTDNILDLNDLIFIDIAFRNTPNITTNNITSLLKGLIAHKKIHIHLFFPDIQPIDIDQDLYEVVLTMLDSPNMYFLKSLSLDFIVSFPAEIQAYQKQIIKTISEQVFNNTTPYLNYLKLFVELPENTVLRLLTLKSFNFQKIWVQLLNAKKLGLLNIFRKEIAWELSEFQELFIF
ncbi:hypothetical protein ABPG74_007288 [Tetrahymena malaccensis]